ncbi:sugar phosphate isomerase/epimerase [Desulfohalobiaceae bacterium Ax17]|uniref:sugar phosphate isomerase/epimerase family protein n=1 Tax=Desulfovulcanus ferrireducens TaxID=2831190 RepID=UPI00207BA9F9|nr:TIM barrel protein [Desulfovulcanus ferrireducens]MBT8763323.1 sugar phosphate isomerase/epimerase [Desulfovulcanus ferrireducens]
MNNFFVNLPLRYIARKKRYLDLFIENRINPELGLEAWSMDKLDLAWHKNVAEKIHRAGLKTAIHLPFLDLMPGSIDQYILQATRKRLDKALEIAKIYEPCHLIGHLAYDSGLDDDFYSFWLENSVQTWQQMAEKTKNTCPIFLENVREQDPTIISDLLSGLNGQVGFCFDLGHWFSFGHGRENNNLGHWLQTLAPYIRHLHLHDNHGHFDEHLGMGQGKIPFVEFFAGLESLELKPGFTLEPHSAEDLAYSLNFMHANRFWFSLLGVKKNSVRDLAFKLK